MSEHPRAATGSHPGDGAQAAVHGAQARLATDDELEQRITRALRSREVAPPAVAIFVDRIETRLDADLDQDEQLATVTHLARRGGKAVAAGVVISALAVYGAGAAAAANPYSDGARTLENVAHAVGIEWSAMPAGYTREQYEAFWGAGYTADDVQTLGELWSIDAIETKARAGQLILDGAAPPLAPGGSDDGPTPVEHTQAQSEALWSAGYTAEDVEALNELWDTEFTETKARAGQMLLDGFVLPLDPSDPGSATD